jgi:glycosyltransferase involved in cell wall biosynthesis
VTRVLLCCSYFRPDVTGIALYATQLARHLSERGYETTVITGFPHYPEWRRGEGTNRLAATEQLEKVRVLRRWHSVPRRQSFASRAAYEASFLTGLTAVGQCGRPDVVIAMSPCLASAAVALAAGKRHSAPVGIIFQDILARASRQSGIGGGRLGALIAPLELAVARSATRIGLTADGFAKVFLQGGVRPERIITLRNWLERVSPSTPPPEARGRLGWRPGEFVCLHAGNMGRKQNLENLIATAALLGEQDIRMAIAGGGNDRTRLERVAARAASAQVTFHGVQEPGAYESMLEAADVLVVNQRATVMDMALPSKLTAYFAAGRPVVAAVAQHSETAAEVRRSGAGIVVAPEAPRALADVLTRLRADASLRHRLGTQGRRYAVEHLRRDVVLPRWIEFVEETRHAGRQEYP